MTTDNAVHFDATLYRRAPNADTSQPVSEQTKAVTHLSVAAIVSWVAAVVAFLSSLLLY